jgi:hypothetical protein
MAYYEIRLNAKGTNINFFWPLNLPIESFTVSSEVPNLELKAFTRIEDTSSS